MFTHARIKLTAFYLLILLCIVAIFSAFLYHYTAQHIQDSVEENTATTQVQHHIADGAIDNLQTTLFTGDAAILLVAGVLAYFLAGKTLRPIQDAHDAQVQFSANASHELRTPLSVMKTENELFIRDKEHSSEARALAESNLEEVNRMSAMVENLLIMARNNKEDATKDFAKTDVSRILKRAMDIQTDAAKAKGLEVIVEFHTPLFVMGNEKLLEQVFTNLIQNSIAYTPSGTVTVRSEKVGHSAVLSINDTGIGIAHENIPHLMKAFYKADSSRTVNSNGVGLGLSIAESIVRIHKGTLRIQSILGKGTTAVVTFPSL
ncbi:MAG: integral rane sensor signal transduction histidine kinase [Parcubacteria group bacterium]|nr:integral rane sensor signal transduction histidine kinase [Parcubacteria group bacterium]